MSEKSRKKISSKAWLVIGVIILIILLMIWLTTADLMGDTDVAAFITPAKAILGL